MVLFVFACALVRTCAQSDQFLPEIDAYKKLDSDLRIGFQAKQTREAGNPIQAEIGPSLDFYLRPLLRLAIVERFDLDGAKSRPLMLSVGYRYLPQANRGPATNRLEPVATFSFPLKAGFVLTDRNRSDLDWESGSFTWRYRNKFEVNRTLAIHSYHAKLYSGIEFFYQSQYGKWSDTAVYAGSVFPIRKHTALDVYYEHQNNTGKSPNQQLNQLGVILDVYF